MPSSNEPSEPGSPGVVRNHWWWRPGWRQGRHLYACHFTVDDQPDLCKLIRSYQGAVAGLPGLDLIPEPWLHVTMQGIGFVDEIDGAELATVTQELHERLGHFPAPTVTFERPTIGSEALVLQADPQQPLYQLRLAMHDTVAGSLPPGKFHRARPEPADFTPHVSFAYVNTDGPADPIARALESVNPEPVTVTFQAASLLVFHRDRRMYEWTRATPVPLGPPKA